MKYFIPKSNPKYYLKKLDTSIKIQRDHFKNNDDK